MLAVVQELLEKLASRNQCNGRKVCRTHIVYSRNISNGRGRKSEQPCFEVRCKPSGTANAFAVFFSRFSGHSNIQVSTPAVALAAVLVFSLVPFDTQVLRAFPWMPEEAGGVFPKPAICESIVQSTNILGQPSNPISVADASKMTCHWWCRGSKK